MNLPPENSTARRFLSENKKFGLELSDASIGIIYEECLKAGSVETGGIIIGRYSKTFDLATATKVTSPPEDSKAGHTWFERGIRGLKDLLSQLWNNTGEYYLGEWHFHPNAEPDPSSTDWQAMETISQSANYRCPEPVLLIVGGSLKVGFKFRAFVCPKSQAPLELKEQL